MQPDPELASFIKQMYGVFESGSTDRVDDLISNAPGAIGIGTDPDEWWVDDAIAAAFRAQVPEMHGAGMRFRAGDIAAYSEGSVGWLADRPALVLPNGAEAQMRMTAVCHRDGGAWKIVQFHLSIGVPNADALGQELTI